ncbi:xanthine dehydrogenase family protein molybdopterin-binding subunit [Rhabdaerophilum sp.]|uniref:xanthine dehydrogenase family protein molybdopterin-binding subunit n=1 Tax=Rhabdaerophilum sp. TaxID=2717341 RepID=UPI0038D408F0
MKFGIGQALTRVEDQRFITGAGHYATDARAKGEARAFVLRAPFAHATFRIRNIEEARAMPGVVLILTGADIGHLGPLPCQAPQKNRDGQRMALPEYPVLPRDTVRHVGEAVAFIVAENLDLARDAAEALDIEWKSLPVAADLATARAPGAPLVHPEAPGNVAFETVLGDMEKTDAVFARAHRVIGLDLVNNRIVANYMEPRSVLAEVKGDSFTITLGSQGSHGLRDTLARAIFRIDPANVRVITPDVGGGFGTKTFMYREYPLAAEAARRLGRPVRWVSDRSEHFFACAHGRDNLTHAEMALDEKGKFLAIRVNLDANMGAYLSQYAPFIPYVGSTMLTGCYDIPTGYTLIRGIYSHSVPIDAYRGAGRPEAAYTIERLVDFIADEIGMDRIALRRLNLVKPRQMPYRTPTGRVYDTGEFAEHMKAAMEKADWKGFPARLRAARRKGLIRGIGLGVYIEACGGGGAEPGHVTLEKDGTVTVRIGTQSNGQGHETAYAQLVAEHLDLPLSQIRVRQGDTKEIASGSGTGGSRSIPVGGAGVALAAEGLAKTLKKLAANALEAGEGDLEIADGAVRIAGTDRRISYAEIAALPAAKKAMLTETASFKPPEATYPNGTHVAEVEIDPATGAIRIVNYVVVDDFGVTVNPVLLAGQIHGGIAQGIGQALVENFVMDGKGQILTASFLDYAMPRAHDMPDFIFETRNVRSTTNILGVKGAGEAGTIGAAPAVMNAVVDALRREKGLRHIDMPATPRRLWEALHQGK